MVATYKHINANVIARTADSHIEYIPKTEGNADYQAYLAWVAAGNEAVPADPAPEVKPSRDQRLLAAVDQAKAAVGAGSVFTKQQAAVLAAAFDGLGAAITGGGSR
jgi:hypothetical protein